MLTIQAEQKWAEAEADMENARLLLNDVKDDPIPMSDLDRRALAVAITNLETAQLWMAKALKK